MNPPDERMNTPHESMSEGRLSALKTILPVLRMLWDSSPRTIMVNLVLRVLSALVPMAVLVVMRWIVDDVMKAHSTGQGMSNQLWGLIALEFALAAAGAILARTILYYNMVAAEQYTRYVSLRLLEHASRLDLVTFEDHTFHDRLERARVQATDRLAMGEAIAHFLQQAVTAVSLCVGILLFSPWVLLSIIVCLLPTAVAEGRFGARLHALNYQNTPRRRELDYLRQLGTRAEDRPGQGLHA